jgi:diguanylate cyclase (GGDEF)-like protein
MSKGLTAVQERCGDADECLHPQVETLFDQPVTQIPGGELIAAFAAGTVGLAIHDIPLLICSAALLLSGFARLLLQQRFRARGRRTMRSEEAQRWRRRYALLSWASSGLVGAFGCLGALSWVADVQLVSACVVLAAAGTIGRSGTPPRMVLVQAVLILLPVALGWLWIGTPVLVMLAGMALPFGALQIRIARNLYDATSFALTAASSTNALADSLAQKNATLEQREAELRVQTVRFNTALDNMAHGLAMFDADLILVVCNRCYCAIYGFDPEVVKPGVSLRAVTEHWAALGNVPDKDTVDFYDAQRRLLTSGEPLVFTRTVGESRLIEVNYRPMAGGGYVVSTEDVTEKRRVSDRIAHLASHDPLTDLVNRSELPRRLAGTLASAQGNGGQVAVLCLDVDRFKAVNDTLGHPAGDALLQEVASRLASLLGPEDTIARLGGDEFVCILAEPGSRDLIATLAYDIAEALSAPYRLAGVSAEASASIGIAVSPDDGSDPDTLLRNADVALYRAKAESRGSFVFFGPEMEREARDRRQLEADLRAGIERGEFELYYQPLVEVRSRKVIGCEALMRWNHPERGLLMPQQFIAIAEESGLIAPLGDWALRQACGDAAHWPRELKVAVNVSPLQVRTSSLLATVVSALAGSALDPARLELEITEAVLLRDSDETLATLTKLRDIGVRIVMDDFGTGYSSLSYLRLFPFDKIKIDRSFIGGCQAGEGSAIIEAVTNLARGLGMATTAEGIETEEQFNAIKARGCTEAQGYLFGHPLPLSVLHPLLAKGWRFAA